MQKQATDELTTDERNSCLAITANPICLYIFHFYEFCVLLLKNSLINSFGHICYQYYTLLVKFITNSSGKMWYLL